MRKIVIDTETTGLYTKDHHRIIEIGCIELINREKTGNTFHVYLNPQREISKEATAIHNITNDDLKDKPLFKDIIDDFLKFINKDTLIFHNAPFDLGFLNYEIKLLKNKKFSFIENSRNIIDTLKLARKKFPGKANNLDALCKRFHINIEKRKFHNAILDAELLSKVYLFMTGGQINLFNNYSMNNKLNNKFNEEKILIKKSNNLLKIIPSENDLKKHINYFNENKNHFSK